MTKWYQNHKYLNAILFLLSISATLLSGYLWYQELLHTNTVCLVSGAGCNSILQSPYAKLWGFPVAGWGVFYYLFLSLIIALRFEMRHFYLEMIFRILVAIGLMFVLYFRYIEFIVLRQFCDRCWLSSVIPTLLITAIAIYEIWIGKRNLA